MLVDIPQELYDKLSARAGEEHVAEVIAGLLEDSEIDLRFPMTDAELRESAAACDRGIADIRAGRGVDFREGMLEIGRQLGFRRSE